MLWQPQHCCSRFLLQPRWATSHTQELRAYVSRAMSKGRMPCTHGQMYDHVESLFMPVPRRVHLIVSVSILGGITRGRRWVLLICGSERMRDGRARSMLAVTDSFVGIGYAIDSDHIGHDPFQIREVQTICLADPM